MAAYVQGLRTKRRMPTALVGGLRIPRLDFAVVWH